MTVTRSMLNTQPGTNTEDLDGMINYARRIEDVKVAALIHEIKNGAGKFTNMNRYHVSLRSDEHVWMSPKSPEKFGGGGHASAAGFQIESTLVALKSKIIELADRFVNRDALGISRLSQMQAADKMNILCRHSSRAELS